MEEAGVAILKATTSLLMEQDANAAKSVWPLSSEKSQHCQLNAAVCLRRINEVAIDTLLTPQAMEKYLWETLLIELSDVEDNGDLSSLVFEEFENNLSHCRHLQSIQQA
jgi:hypothetical protein